MIYSHLFYLLVSITPTPSARLDRVVYIAMATAGTRSQKPVGSAAWISSEKENIHHLVDQEMEEIAYPVSHEMAWLNEHMAEVFSKNQLCVPTVIRLA